MTENRTAFRTRLSRRRLLSGIGALTATLTSPIWRVSTAFGQAQPAHAAQHFIGLFSSNGTIASEFFPGCSGSTRPNSCPNTAADTPLTPTSLGRILQPLATHTSQMMVLKGVDMVSTVSDMLGTTTAKPGGPHMKGPGAMLTGGSLLPGSFSGAGGPAGWADRISVDQTIALRIGKATAFPSLEFAVRAILQEPLRVISYAGSNTPNLPIQDPQQMYTKMFANKNLTPMQLSRLLTERKSVLDFLQADIGVLGSRLSAADKARLDTHLTGIRAIEQQLTNSAASCTAPAAPVKIDVNSVANFATVAQMQMDLMLLAQTCGMTRVSTFMFANANSLQFFPFAGVNEEHHGLSHCGDNDSVSIEKLIKINIWHAQQVAYLLDKLAATIEPDGSKMLDNTLLLWGNELGRRRGGLLQDGSVPAVSGRSSQQSLGFPLQRDGSVRRHHLRYPRSMHRTASGPRGLSLR